MACRLHIKICEAQKVLRMDLGGQSDPYITLRLKSEEKSDCLKTQVIRKTRNPIWNQEFDIIVTDSNDVLLINMYHEYFPNDDKMMDEIQFPVSTWPIGDPLDRKELDLKLKKKKAGKLIFEVQSFPLENSASDRSETEGCRIRIKAFDAKNVLESFIDGSDLYLRFGLKGKKDSTFKTAVISGTLNPVWNQELEIISTDRRKDILEVEMFDEDISHDYTIIEIPLRDHPNKTHYTFNDNITLKEKGAGQLHFELDFEPIEGEEESSETLKEGGEEEEEENVNYNVQFTNSKIKLLTNSISHVPLDIYEKDFVFIVNEQPFETRRIVSDLISPTVSKLHQNDPTVSEFRITTSTKGDFQTILDLVSFETKEIIKEEEIDFIAEVFEQLGIENASVKTNKLHLTMDNVIELIAKHERFSHFYASNLTREIEYLSRHMFEMKEKHKEHFLNLSSATIERVISNDHLQIESEDQLLNLIDRLYIKNNEFSKLYEFVFFSNVGSEAIEEFLSIFNFDDLTTGAWLSIAKRIHCEVKRNEKQLESRRYSREIKYSNENFNGVFNYLSKNSNIDEEVSVTASSNGGGDWHQLIDIGNTNNCYYTNSESNPSICFEFKKHRIMPTNYTIRAHNSSSGNRHPKSWIIEGSEDNKKWIKIDERIDCSFLNGAKRVHTFHIKNEEEKEFKFIRIKHINNTWDNSNNAIYICSIEFYGNLI